MYMQAVTRVPKLAPQAGATALLLATAALGGCYYEDNDSPPPHVGGSGGSGPGGEVFEAVIQSGETLVTQPGEGAGVFIEYLGEGTWHVFTSCDTNVSGYDCEWDVLAEAHAGDIWDIEADDLEGVDTLYTIGYGSAGLYAFTGTDLDGMYFQTEPGDVVRFTVAIDGYFDGRYTYWNGPQAVHAGAPSNPLDLRPSDSN